MFLRSRFAFDPSPSIEGWRQLNILAASKDRRTWWVNAGRRGGIRGLVHYNDQRFGATVEAYWGQSLHSDVLVSLSGDAGARIDVELARAADTWARQGLSPAMILTPENCLVRVQGNLVKSLEPDLATGDGRYPLRVPNGTTQGHRLPVPGFLPLAGSMPAVGEPPAQYQHKDGWYTRSERALHVRSPQWAPNASVYDIREGIYIVFSDGTFRLVPRREYYEKLEWDEPEARQGDLLLWHNPQKGVDRPIATDEPEYFDRHKIVAQDDGSAVVTHPEHGELVVSAPGLNQPLYAAIAPGTSRPFERESDRD